MIRNSELVWVVRGLGGSEGVLKGGIGYVSSSSFLLPEEDDPPSDLLCVHIDIFFSASFCLFVKETEVELCVGHPFTITGMVFYFYCG